jgi:hypothetical protein
MANAAPMLLIFVAFFALTAETWEVAYELPLRTLLGLCALLLAVAAVLVLGWSIALLRRERQFRDWADVDKQLDDFAKALYELPKDRESASIAEHLKHWVGAGACEQPVSRLSVTAWINAFLVVLVYQFFIFGAIAVILFLLFLMLAQIAVPAPVAAEWIFGDGQQEMASRLDRVSVEAFGGLLQGDLNVLNSPWFRVPLFLTLFCSLQFAAQSLTSEESRGRYFRGIDIAIRRRFAIHLAYRLLQLNPNQQLNDRHLPTRELP